MKVFFAILVCVLTVDFSVCIQKKNIKLPPEAASILIVAVQRCMPETGVSIDALLKVYQGGYNEDKNFKNFIYCCYKNSGYLKLDGRIDTEKSVNLFKNEPAVVEGVTRCAEATGRNAKEAVFNYFKCFQDTVPVRFTI